MSTSSKHPKVFISYSWSGAEHEHFVIELATALRTHGVDAILDKWRLKPGQDKFVFMESMVTDADVVKVLVLCDERYKEKADARSGGVGTESQIISQELYGKVAQDKFIPVVCERGEDGEEFLPVFMKGRIYVDLSSEEKFGEGLDQLLRLIFEQPLYAEPGLGDAPTFLKGEEGGLRTAKELPAALRAVREGRPNREGLERLFIKSAVAEIDRVYVRPVGNEGYDELIYQAILSTKGLRDQVSEYIDTVTSFGTDEPRSFKALQWLLEQLGQRFGPPIENGTYMDSWADIYRFFALEACLIAVAASIRFERWKMLRQFLRFPYLIRTTHSGSHTADVLAFDTYIVSMDEHRNNRLRTNRLSLTADMLKERCSNEHTPFGELVQADVFLALYGVTHLSSTKKDGIFRFWGPRTAIYTNESRQLPLFMKAVDPEIRTGILTALGVSSGKDLADRVAAAKTELNDFRQLSMDRFGRFSFAEAVNLDVLILG